jgi:hypothetical protein
MKKAKKSRQFKNNSAFEDNNNQDSFDGYNLEDDEDTVIEEVNTDSHDD